MKIWISCDMEGVAGIVNWDQCRPGNSEYTIGRALLLAEVNAAIDGAIRAGATDIIVNDSHGRMANLDPRGLAGNARYLSGSHKPLYMMEGLDDTSDAIFLVGYHGSISGPPSVLSHSYNPEVFSFARLNGQEVGESGINALVAAHYGVPIALVAGDAATVEQAAPFAPDAHTVATKESVSRFSALNLHPDESCRRIRDAAENAGTAVSRGAVRPPHVTMPARLELGLQTADMADVATWAKGAERSGQREVTIQGSDLLAVFRSFVAVNYITRQAGGR